MPLYDYQCVEGHRHELFHPLAELDTTHICPTCRGVLHRCLSAPRVFGDYPGYNCPNTGRWVEGKRAHLENLKRQGCRILEPGESDAARNRIKAEEAAFDKSLDNTVEELVASLPPRQMEQLASEVQHGVTATVERG